MGLFSGIGKALGGIVGAVTGSPALSLASSALGFLGQERANDVNQNIASANNAMSIELANTQYQRRVKDLSAAGLNPMIAYMPGSGGGSGGAAVPSFQQAKVENSAASGIRSGMEAAQSALLASQVKTQETQSELNSANAAKAMAERDEVVARTPRHEFDIENVKFDTEQKRALIDNIRAELPIVLERLDLTHAEVLKVHTEISQLIKQGNLSVAQTEHALASAGLTRAQIAKIQPEISKILAETASIRALQPVKDLGSRVGSDAVNLYDIMQDSIRDMFTHSAKDGQSLLDRTRPSWWKTH